MNALRRTTATFSPARAGARFFSATPRAPLAKMQIIGRLGAEPELYTAPSGTEMVRYVLGTSTGRRDAQETSWFNVTAFDEGPRRDYLLALPKGTLMHVEADAKMSSYETNEGQKRTALRLTQRNIEILSRPRQAGGDAGHAEGSA